LRSFPTTLPNWVDLLVVFLFVRACYVGYNRGAVTELVHLLGIVGMTALAVNGYEWLGRKLSGFSPFDPAMLNFICFLLLFLVGLLLVHRVLYRLTASILRERGGSATVTSVFGAVFGAARGGWSTGLLLMLLLSLGIPYFQASVNERSILGPSVVRVSTQAMQAVVGWLPGSQERPLMPGIIIQLPKMPWSDDEAPPPRRPKPTTSR
jgi:uncharacterized membrane protein required for colicin V production